MEGQKEGTDGKSASFVSCYYKVIMFFFTLFECLMFVDMESVRLALTLAEGFAVKSAGRVEPDPYTLLLEMLATSLKVSIR